MEFPPPAGSTLGLLIRIIFWGAIVYAVMRSIWALWEVPQKLEDIEKALARLSVDLQELSGRLKEKDDKLKEQAES